LVWSEIRRCGRRFAPSARSNPPPLISIQSSRPEDLIRRNFQRQRRCGNQPRFAKLSWVIVRNPFQPQRGCGKVHQHNRIGFPFGIRPTYALRSAKTLRIARLASANLSCRSGRESAPSKATNKSEPPDVGCYHEKKSSAAPKLPCHPRRSSGLSLCRAARDRL
jgi:hypothetical protein